MIRVEVYLDSAISPDRSKKLGEMHIANDDTGNTFRRNYDGQIMRKPDFVAVTRTGRVEGHNADGETIWHLVAKMLRKMGY